MRGKKKTKTEEKSRRGGSEDSAGRTGTGTQARQSAAKQETVAQCQNTFGNSLFALLPCQEVMVWGIFSITTVHIYNTGLTFSDLQTFGGNSIRCVLLWFGCGSGTKRLCLHQEVEFK